MFKPSLVIFDLDGTLVDSVGDLTHAINHMLTRLGVSEVTSAEVRGWIGDGAKVLVERALVHSGLKQDQSAVALEWFLNCYRTSCAVHTECYDGVQALLNYLQEQSIAMALVSNKPHELIEPVLKHVGIDQYFSWFAGGDRFEHKKPHPQPLEACLAFFNCDPAHALMIGDSDNDILAARGANVRAIAVDYGYGSLLHQPDQTVSSLAQLIPL